MNKSISFADARLNMVESQIRPYSVIDLAVTEAFRIIPREAYVPEALASFAYMGEELAVGQGRFLLEPAAHARLLQAVQLTPEMRVLDVGCLQGYSSAILAQIVQEVVAVDTSEWIKAAEKTAKKYPQENITFAVGDMTKGYAQAAPYDAIIINGAIQEVPTHLIAQLRAGGVIATFNRQDNSAGQAVLYTLIGDHLIPQILFDAFVPVLAGFEKFETFVF